VIGKNTRFGFHKGTRITCKSVSSRQGTGERGAMSIFYLQQNLVQYLYGLGAGVWYFLWTFSEGIEASFLDQQQGKRRDQDKQRGERRDAHVIVKIGNLEIRTTSGGRV